jgi:YidC/Oxa1 family membrane protein insertase
MWDAIIISPFTNIMLFINNLVGQNFGITIILFTILIRLVTWPLNSAQIKSTKVMQAMQSDKKFLEIQSKYKNDREKLAQAQMDLYKEKGYNPFASCLPLIIQFPIIIGLYQTLILALANTPLDLLNLTRHVYTGFINISQVVPLSSHFLWMDLGQPDRVFIPGIPWGIPVLAIVVVITTYLQQKMITPPSATPNDQNAQMMGMMSIYMPLLMGWIAWTLQAGLAVYFVVTNLFTIGQYIIMGNVNWSSLLPKRKVASAPVKKN